MYETYLSKLTNLLKITSNNKKLTGEEEKREIQKSQYQLSQCKDEVIEKSIEKNIPSEKIEENHKLSNNQQIVEKQLKSNNKEVEYTNHDGIVIDQSDNLLNFDEGNESPDSD